MAARASDSPPPAVAATQTASASLATRPTLTFMSPMMQQHGAVDLSQYRHTSFAPSNIVIQPVAIGKDEGKSTDEAGFVDQNHHTARISPNNDIARWPQYGQRPLTLFPSEATTNLSTGQFPMHSFPGLLQTSLPRPFDPAPYQVGASKGCRSCILAIQKLRNNGIGNHDPFVCPRSRLFSKSASELTVLPLEGQIPVSYEQLGIVQAVRQQLTKIRIHQVDFARSVGLSFGITEAILLNRRRISDNEKLSLLRWLRQQGMHKLPPYTGPPPVTSPVKRRRKTPNGRPRKKAITYPSMQEFLGLLQLTHLETTLVNGGIASIPDLFQVETSQELVEDLHLGRAQARKILTAAKSFAIPTKAGGNALATGSIGKWCQADDRQLLRLICKLVGPRPHSLSWEEIAGVLGQRWAEISPALAARERLAKQKQNLKKNERKSLLESSQATPAKFLELGARLQSPFPTASERSSADASVLNSEAKTTTFGAEKKKTLIEATTLLDVYTRNKASVPAVASWAPEINKLVGLAQYDIYEDKKVRDACALH